MPTFYIRKLTAQDITLLQHVGRATYEPYYAYLWYEGGLDWYMDRCFNTAALEAECNDPNIAYHLITTGDAADIVGFIKLVLLKPVPVGGLENALFLEKIYLMPEFMGKGIGRELMAGVIQKAQMLGREAVWLTCMDSGPVSVYEARGFQIVHTYRLDDFTLMKEKYRGIHVMVKPLNAPMPQ